MKDSKCFCRSGAFTKSWLYEDGANSPIFDLLCQRIEGKLKKLNDGGYHVCDRYELFIETGIQIREEWCSDIFAKIIEISDKHRIRYLKIMVLSQMNFVIFDIKNDKSYSINIDASKLKAPVFL